MEQEKKNSDELEKELLSVGATLLPPNSLFLNNNRKVLYKGCVLPGFTAPILKKVIEFQAHDDDIFIDTFYKAGTSWLQVMVFLICRDPDCRLEMGSKHMETEVPYLEMEAKTMDLIENMESPRLIKTHMHYKILPQSIKDKKCKIIYVARNPKDILISAFTFLRDINLFQYSGSIEDLMSDIINDRDICCPFWEHVLDFWNRRHDSNILFCKYEDMKKDLKTEVHKVMKFLGKELTEEQINKITDRCTFQSMRRDPFMDRTYLSNKKDFQFLRKGEVGDWKNYFTPQMNEIMDAWYKKNTNGTDFFFDFEP